MRNLSAFAAVVGLALTVIGTAPTAAAPDTETPGAGVRSSGCAATTDAQKLAVARAWHEEVVNRRHPAALRDILAPDIVHHAAAGRPDPVAIPPRWTGQG